MDRRAWEWGVSPGPSSAPEVWAGVQRGGQCDWEVGAAARERTWREMSVSRSLGLFWVRTD